MTIFHYPIFQRFCKDKGERVEFRPTPLNSSFRSGNFKEQKNL